MQDAVIASVDATGLVAPEPLRIPGYDLLDVLGVGGYGTVHRATQHHTGNTVAINVV